MFDEVKEILIKAKDDKNKMLASDKEIYESAKENTKMLIIRIWEEFAGQWVISNSGEEKLKFKVTYYFPEEVALWGDLGDYCGLKREQEKAEGYNFRNSRNIAFVELESQFNKKNIVIPILFEELRKIMVDDGVEFRRYDGGNMTKYLEFSILNSTFDKLVSTVQISTDKIQTENNNIKKKDNVRINNGIKVRG